MYRILKKEKMLGWPIERWVSNVVSFDGIKFRVELFEGRVKEVLFYREPNLNEVIKVAKKEFPKIPIKKLRVKVVTVLVLEYSDKPSHTRIFLRPIELLPE